MVAASKSSPLRPLLTVVVPVYNGGDEIVDNVSAIRRAVVDGLNGEDVETIVVSDGSIDDTAERLLAARGDLGIRVIHYDRNLGKGYAVRAGALASHGVWVALVDADLDLDPVSIPSYLEVARRERLDFAIGSKRHPDSVVHYPRSRRIASWWYQQLNRVLFRLDVRDTQVGLKVFSRRVVEEVMPLLLVKRFAFDLELLAVAKALGYGRVRELPVRLEYRFTGSGVRSTTVLLALWDTAAIFYRRGSDACSPARFPRRSFRWSSSSATRALPHCSTTSVSVKTANSSHFRQVVRARQGIGSAPLSSSSPNRMSPRSSCRPSRRSARICEVALQLRCSSPVSASGRGARASSRATCARSPITRLRASSCGRPITRLCSQPESNARSGWHGSPLRGGARFTRRTRRSRRFLRRSSGHT